MSLDADHARRLTERFAGMAYTPEVHVELATELTRILREDMRRPSIMRQAFPAVPVIRRPDGSPIAVDRTSGPLYTPFRWETEETVIERPQRMVEFTAYEEVGRIVVNAEAVARVDFGAGESYSVISAVGVARKNGYRTLREIREAKRFEPR